VKANQRADEESYVNCEVSVVEVWVWVQGIIAEWAGGGAGRVST
jgi:hypothetical protein